MYVRQRHRVPCSRSQSASFATIRQAVLLTIGNTAPVPSGVDWTNDVAPAVAPCSFSAPVAVQLRVQELTATLRASIEDFSSSKIATPQRQLRGKAVEILWHRDSCIFISALPLTALVWEQIAHRQTRVMVRLSI